MKNREDALLSTIMRLIQAELRDAPRSMSDNRVYHVVNEIARRANDDLHNALPNDDMRYYMSDSVYDEITNAMTTLSLARDVMDLMFNDASSVEIVDAITELIEDMLPTIDDLIDDEEYLPVGIEDLISIIRR